MRTYSEVIDAREKELEKFRDQYQEAKALTAGRDGREMLTLARLLKSYQMGDHMEKAVYIVAQATMLVNKMVEPFAVIEAFEQKKKDFEALKKQAPTG